MKTFIENLFVSALFLATPVAGMVFYILKAAH